jgi:hypothetical protein
MSRDIIVDLKKRAAASDLGEAVDVLLSRRYCRVSLVARYTMEGCLFFLEVVERHDFPLTDLESASRRRLSRRLACLGFQLVQENGSRVYELAVGENDFERVVISLSAD